MQPDTTTKLDNGYRIIGTNPIRHDGIEKVTGSALYGADIQLPGLLHGKVLRSPHPHALIKSIDVSIAEAHPEVKAVATSKDLAVAGPIERRIDGESSPINNILAGDKVFYTGHAIAAVAATNPHAAEEALSLIKVNYKILPFVTNVEDAIKPDAPALHEHWANENSENIGAISGLNIAGFESYVSGDLDKGFEKADLVLEREFRTKTVHQGYIEPQNATASWAPDGRLTIWCSSQGHFGIRDSVARILDIPVSQINVIPMEIGGGFGGKLSCYLEPVASVLSRKSGHPVKMTMTRSEVLQATGPTSGSLVRVKIGVTNQGRITATDIYFAFEAGAYPGGPISAASSAVLASYDIKNFKVEGYAVVDNKPKTSAYRAPGAPNVCFPVESTVDEIAERLKMDPMEFRLLNVAEQGARRVDGLINGPIGAREIMENVKSHPHYSAPINGKNRGRGVGMGFCRNGTGEACAIANVLPNGNVSLIEGSMDIGGTRTAVAQQFAEVLSLPIEDIIPKVADTDTIGYTSSTGGSSVVFKTGWAAHEAAHDVMRQLIERASIIWDVPQNQVEYVNGVLQHKSDPELHMTFKEISSMLPDTGGPIVGRANINPGGAGGSYSANIVDVEVDIETGKVTILRLTALQDAGKAIYPDYVEGQIQGGTAQGIGWALHEEYFMSKDGKLLNSSLLDYRMPTALDIPMIETIIVEAPNPGHPFGVRGIGEANIVPPLAAIANAIYNAIGIRMSCLPMNPGAIVKALK